MWAVALVVACAICGNVDAYADKYLVTGCGYSGTLMTTHILAATGQRVLHECVGLDGSVAWEFAFAVVSDRPHRNIRKCPHNAMPRNPSEFSNVVCQVRHPFKVIASGYDTQFNFANYGEADIVVPRELGIAREVFLGMRREYQLLAWWYVYTRRAVALSDGKVFRFMIDPYSVLLGHLGIRCDDKCTSKVGALLKSPLNSHKKRDVPMTWTALTSGAWDAATRRVVELSMNMSLGLALGEN